MNNTRDTYWKDFEALSRRVAALERSLTTPSISSDDTVVGVPIPPLTSAEDLFTWIYDYSTNSMVWVALPSGGSVPITIWSPTNADLYNESGEGWFLPGDATDMKFVCQGNTVHVSGVVQWTGASNTYTPSHTSVIRPSMIPAEFRPIGSHSHVMTSEDADLIWIFKLFTNGVMSLGTLHAAAAGSVFGGVGANSTDFFTSYTFTFEDWSYPLSRTAT